MPSKPMIMVLGPSGSGKSTSLEHLPREVTALIDLERKGMPFKDLGFFKYIEAKTFSEAEIAIKTVQALSEVKIVVIDSITKYLDYLQLYCATVFKGQGHEIWGQFLFKAKSFLNNCKSSNAITIATAIDEIDRVNAKDGTKFDRIQAAVPGGQLKGKLEAEFLIVLESDVVVDEKSGEVNYIFRTTRQQYNTVKVPRWLDLPATMPNDLRPIVDKLL